MQFHLNLYRVTIENVVGEEFTKRFEEKNCDLTGKSTKVFQLFIKKKNK